MRNHSGQPEQSKRISELEFQVEQLRDELYRKDDLIAAMQSSVTWRLSQACGRLIGVESPWRRRLSTFAQKLRKRRSTGKPLRQAVPLPTVTDAHFRIVHDFIMASQARKGIFIVIAGPALRDRVVFRSDQLSHRAVKLAREFGALGFAVLYVFAEFRKDINVEAIERVDDALLQMHFSLFSKLYRSVFDECEVASLPSKTLLIQILNPSIPEILGYANAYNWKTVYDAIDNWEEFYKAGWHPWYSRKVEAFTARNADVRIAVSPYLQRKLDAYGDVHVLSNGYSPYPATDYAHELGRGAITIGYFGNLQEYRFDWILLLASAERHKDWLFYLIGFLPEGMTLPANVVHIKPINPAFLHAYARNWDVAIVPFKINDLTISCDNLKIYEYLSFRLPVVARGVGEHFRSYPYVCLAETEKEFEESIIRAASVRMEEEVIRDFLGSATWRKRAEEMLRTIQSTRSLYKEIIFEGAFHS